MSRQDKPASQDLTMRGKGMVCLALLAGLGLIPAHAGKTHTAGHNSQPSRAHPRSRGENSLKQNIVIVNEGSSPLTRGKLGVRLFAGLKRRLIPAHAGKTTWPPAWIAASWAHPRSRGENGIRESGFNLDAGSSPLTRGKLTLIDPTGALNGLIPAHAGKTKKARAL